MEISGLVTAELNGARPLSHAVVSKELHSPSQHLPRRLVVMKQISSQQDKVHL